MDDSAIVPPTRAGQAVRRRRVALGLALLILTACSAAPGAVARPSATAGLGAAPAVRTAVPTRATRLPTATPVWVPTDPPVPTFTLPPTPERLVTETLGQLAGPLLLYHGPGGGPALLLHDLATGTDLWLTAQIADKACDLNDRTVVDWQRGMWSADGRFLLLVSVQGVAEGKSLGAG